VPIPFYQVLLAGSLGLLAMFGLPSLYAAQEPGQQVILVTGSTGGLGREVALGLAASGAHIIVHGPNVERGASLVDEIERAGAGSARFYAADFGSYEKIRDFASVILRDYERRDVLNQQRRHLARRLPTPS
jgi:NADP-dependent 3-hydroxy acid dehydrogenase YdfG